MKLVRDFSQTTAILADPDEPLTAAIIYSLSDLSPEDLALLAERWPTYPVERRRNMLRRLTEVSETNFEVNFDAVNTLALEDPDEEVRVAAIEGLWENESVAHMHRLIAIATSDPTVGARAAAAGALGRFVLLGEFEKFPQAEARLAQDAALEILGRADEHLEVRRRALETIANCGREGVAELIEEAYAEPSVKMRASAIFAMGRSCDQRWRKAVLAELEADEPEILYEAARAAGELELHDAVGRLSRLLHHDDRELQLMAVWALGEIGDSRARRILEELSEVDLDADFADAVDEALETAYLVGGDMRFDMFNFNGDFEEDDDDEYGLSDGYGRLDDIDEFEDEDDDLY